ncbi:amidohydrolase AmhX [Caldalkalibacillus thermarum]|uniref:M20 peptidase aminoacylase family protein n=1 Tax=Caldalkalibacillus thermarum TaxID=296745 RepID=UPI00166E45E9|nr:M20 peptidase aminoacylase family protein [Caldalkalibacillus thermarum]GGK29135.1 amidohydrolase AmhX [Caldalkalibacillus thermarum]
MVKRTVHGLREELLAIFNHLHQHPEVSWHEVETTRYIADYLRRYGCRVTTFDDCTGVVSEMGKGKPVVAVRADMDALWQEVDGVWQANHSCGHDGHMTIVLGVCLALRKLDFQPSGTVKFIFQPAEEKGTGALKMVEKGVVDDVDYLFSVHLRPVQELGKGKAAPAILHGAAQFISGEIKGTDAHGARPHLGTNAIEIGVELVHILKGIHLDPMIPYSVKMTRFTAGGESANIIPGSAQFSLDLRAQTNKAMDELAGRVEKAVEKLGQLHGVQIELEHGARTAAAEVDPEAEAIMAEAITQTLGAEHLVPPIVTTGGEDFHFYTIKKPHLKATMLGLGCDLKPGLHHPHMTFDREALLDGVEILTRAVCLAFDKVKGGS